MRKNYSASQLAAAPKAPVVSLAYWQDLVHGRHDVPRTAELRSMSGRNETPSVLHLIANLDRGGAQEVVRTVVRDLPATGWRPVVAAFRDGPLRAAIEADGVRVRILRGRRHSILSPVRAWSELRAIRRELRDLLVDERASVVQTHLLGSLDFLPLSLRRADGPRVLWTVHNALLDLRPDQLPPRQRSLLRAKRAGFRVAYRGLGRLVDGFVCVSDDVAAAVAHAYRPPRGRIFVVPNGVDVQRYAGATGARAELRASMGLPADALLLIVVAKLYAQKGHRVLFDALGDADLPDSHAVLLVGEGPERAALERQAEARGLAAIRFLGNRDDIPELLAASDLFVLPSLWEGLPMALLEGMAAGLPVVATEVAGTRQVVTSGESGMLVPAGDAPSLAAAISRLAGDATERERLGRAAHARVEREFSSTGQAARHAEVYAAVLARGQRS